MRAMNPEQRATLIALVGTAWQRSMPVAEVPGGFIEAPEFIDWFNTQIDAALAEGPGGFGVSLPAPTGPMRRGV